MKLSLTILSMISLCYGQLTGPLPGITADMDFFCYYGGFGPVEVWQAQYFDLFILEPNQISAEQVQDIRNGFDDVLGTEDDVLVFGYVSIGETYYNDEVGDGTGPVYFNGTDTVYQNAGYASYFLDDFDHDSQPDENGTWSSYYVNAGDSAWWEFNAARLDETLYIKNCDGLFMDTMGVPFPASWGGSYEWTTAGMANYVAFLRAQYPEKYLFGNNPSLYMHPALPGFAYLDLIRNSMNAYMYESYYLTWDWDQEIGYVSPWFENARDTWAPIINTEAAKVDGYTTVALDYVNVDQPDYAVLLANQIQFTEVDLGWLTAVSSVWLNEIRYDTYHNHPIDNNSPTWPSLPGILYHELDGSDIKLYWNAAVDQTEPVSYRLYFETSPPDFSDNSNFIQVNPGSSQFYDWEYTISNVIPDTEYYAVLRAADGAPEVHIDQNRRIVPISTSPDNPLEMSIDGFFTDWVNVQNIDDAGEVPELINDAPIPACDFENLWISADADNLYFSCSFAETPQLGTYYYHVFLDVDEDSSTGFHYAGAQIGADYMVENYSLHRYTGVDDSWNWEFVGGIDLVSGFVETNRFEGSIPLNILDIQGTSLALVFNVNDNADLGPDDFAPDTYTERSYRFDLSSLSIDLPVLPRETIISTYPNPFNQSMTFRLESASVTGEKGQLNIYDVSGKLTQVIEVNLTHGTQLIWNGNDIMNHPIESGVYLYQLINVNQEKGHVLSSGKIVAIK